jgi:FAD synthase
VAFLARIRDERKFASVEELSAQIACDIRQARHIHAQRPA